MEKKYYYYFGYEIVRTPHYVNAYKHYDYIVDMHGRKKVFDRIEDAKKWIKSELYNK